jgi:hypothetical protein
MRRIVVKPRRDLSRLHTIIEAAEQALPNSRARAGGRVFIPRAAPIDRPPVIELVASWS